MQVASTLWPDIKSQKISEHRFRLKWTKCSPRTQLRPLKIGQDQWRQDKKAQDSLLDEAGGGWHHWQAGRPAWSADLARGPHRLSQATLHLLVGPLGQFGEFHPVGPCYKYKDGVENRTHTHLTTLTSCIVFRLSGDQEESRSLRVAIVAREFWYGFISSCLL